ncbi:MAG TPA: hypothetical protein VJB05_04015 [archaeon]|nr:hypothetical protein [archaeon]
MSAGSYIRFIIGLVLSLTVLWSFLTGGTITMLTAILAIIFLVLAVLWVAFRF